MSSHPTRHDRHSRPLLFSPPLAASRVPRRPRCPDIFMLGPGDEQSTLAALMTSLGQQPAEPEPVSEDSEAIR